MLISEFWEMTPRETLMALEAVGWQREQEHRGRAWLAWHVAVLSRVRILPALSMLLRPPSAKRPQGDALEKRRQEFKKMSENFNRACLGGPRDG